jgi:hypothetical protein
VRRSGLGRVIAAVLVSNLAFSVMALVSTVLTSWWLHEATWLEEESMLGMLIALAGSFTGLSILVAISVLPFALLFAVLGWRLNWRARWGHVLCGAVLGFRFGLAFLGSPANVWITFLTYVAAGAVCGWIYWTIAFRRTRGNAHAIDPA